MQQSARHVPRYRHIANRIASAIDDGTYEPGERIPSIRHLSTSFGVSINTMRSALSLLQDMGLVDSRPRTGTFVVARRAAPDASNYVDDFVDSVVCEYRDRLVLPTSPIRFDLAVVPEELVPTPLIRSSMQAALHESSPLLHGFATFERTAGARSAISRRELLHGVPVHPDHLVFASSIESALLQLLLVLNPERLPVAVQVPTYYNHLTTLRALGMPVFELPLRDDHAIDADLLRRGMETENEALDRHVI